MVKTKTVQYQDGRREVIRLLAIDDIDHWSAKDPLAYEKSIVWLENIDALKYVRTAEVRCARSRRGPLVVQSGGRVVGYAKLTPDAPKNPHTEYFTRRVFYLKEEDLAAPPGPPPANALDPKTIFPGVRGEPPAVAAPVSAPLAAPLNAEQHN